MRDRVPPYASLAHAHETSGTQLCAVLLINVMTKCKQSAAARGGCPRRLPAAAYAQNV